MRLAMLVGTLLFTFVSGFYGLGGADIASAPDNQTVQSYDETFPPPPSWP
jgi:hypothetical protein